MIKLPIKIYLIAGMLFVSPFVSFSQSGNKPNWQNLDLKTDSTFGISTEKAYKELLKGKKATPVVVAVIDGGVDIDHEDLKAVIWTNPKEIAGNKKDDDKNGYIDDIHGWDFIGGPNGEINYENLEATRILRKLKPKFDNVTSEAAVSAADKADYKLYLTVKEDVEKQYKDAKTSLDFYKRIKFVMDSIAANIPQGTSVLDYFKAYQPTTREQNNVRANVIRGLPQFADFEAYKKKVLGEAITHYSEIVDYQVNLDFHPRDIVGDDPNNSKERFYGNNNVNGPDAHHGSHVAGIIAAVRDNNIGIQGIADHAIIMSVRTVPNGDERDKDVANAIRYAAANGAKVINMSFGKGYSWDKAVVDEAVKFAMSKDVLIIHAAGNENKNLDADGVYNFPNKFYENNGGTAANWIEVGASGPKDNDKLKASFSNYGKKSVDVFAPGVLINSTIPGSTYAEYSGTSMACPVVVGLATLIREYYPKLTAAQVKDIILKTVVPVTHDVTVTDGKQIKKIPFTDLCVTGGIVNAYDALKLAGSM
ncbi:S8 family peptidase [Mucilaginibacter sp. HMF5004]|uniref:S8 family peptidase n=1 Tax=Mucilaginibacter rivuli TaxID=2857527 RepID=UPI001C5E539D|nr:S8 family peptidase [Mucilaginibacter rivuli]MBW4891893.1 S8 family peptidase [Mucilaginibacter rivuli]